MKDYELISFILRGERRKAILLSLEKPLIPKKIAEKCKVSIHNVSKSLKELVARGLIVCKNPNDKFYRFYELTLSGRKLLKEISSDIGTKEI